MPNGTVDRLIDEYLALADSCENRRRLDCWEREVCARDQFHGRPRQRAFRDHGLVPLQLDVQNTFFAPVMKQNLAEVYEEPAVYLEFYLAKRIFVFRELPDDTPLDGTVPVYLATPFETSLYGMGYHLFADSEPMIDQSRSVISSEADLVQLPPVDFYSSGMMPLARRMFEQVSELVAGRLQVVFPEWLRGPFGVALYLRGYQDLLVDFKNSRQFAHHLMERINEDRQAWFMARSAYLSQPVSGGSLFNDEVDASVIGPRHYLEHILPYEAALAEFHGEITYWHSCGDTGPMAHDICGGGRIGLLDVSGWTDLERVLQTVDTNSQRFEVRFNPIKDLQDATPDQMQQAISRKLDLCRKYDANAFTLRVSGIQPWRGLLPDLTHMRTWIEICRRLTGAA